MFAICSATRPVRGCAAGFVICPCAAGGSAPRALRRWATRAGRATFWAQLEGVRADAVLQGASSPVQAGGRMRSWMSWRMTCRYFPLMPM